jgi:hypothetical protein
MPSISSIISILHDIQLVMFCVYHIYYSPHVTRICYSSFLVKFVCMTRIKIMLQWVTTAYS